MDIKDKRLIERMEPEEQDKYIRDISGRLPDVQHKLEEYEITHKQINLLKRLRQKPVDESKKA
jgi:hypothetical protein